MSTLGTGLLGFAQGALGTLSNEYESINKEKGAIRAEDRANQRQLEKERRDEDRAKAAEKRAAKAQELRDLRLHGLGIARDYMRGEIAQTNQLEQRNVDLDAVMSDADPAVIRARKIEEDRLDARLKSDQERKAAGLPIPGSRTSVPNISGKTAYDAVSSGLDNSLDLGTKINPQTVKDAVERGKDSLTVISTSDKPSKVAEVLQNPDKMNMLRAQTIGAYKLGLKVKLSQMSSNKELTDESVLQNIIDESADTIQTITDRWEGFGRIMDKDGQLLPAHRAAIEEQVALGAKAGFSRAEVMENMRKAEEARLRSMLGNSSTSFNRLNKIQNSILRHVYPSSSEK